MTSAPRLPVSHTSSAPTALVNSTSTRSRPPDACTGRSNVTRTTPGVSARRARHAWGTSATTALMMLSSAVTRPPLARTAVAASPTLVPCTMTRTEDDAAGVALTSVTANSAHRARRATTLRTLAWFFISIPPYLPFRLSNRLLRFSLLKQYLFGFSNHFLMKPPRYSNSFLQCLTL